MVLHLVLKFEAPLIAFGGETIDNLGVNRQFPAKSMVAGLIANALGIDRTETARLQSLQDHLVMGSRIDRQGLMHRDFQSVALSLKDKGWTTRGSLESRAGGNSGAYLRYRDYWADACIRVVFRFEKNASLSLAALKDALSFPARPLFLGRKPCLPAGFLCTGAIEAASIYDALLALPQERDADTQIVLQWPVLEGSAATLNETAPFEPICDERNWTSGVHGGLRLVRTFAIGEAPA